ncbi:hypothetical protein MHYP_G00190320 [Metynnis hypsauchen]
MDVMSRKLTPSLQLQISASADARTQQQSIRNLKPRPALLTQPTLLLLNTPDLQGQIRQLNAWPASPPEPTGVQPKVLDH